MKSLDHVFANEYWLQIFPNEIVTHLYKTYSDHNPILVKLNNGHQNLLKPFRLESIWCNHPDFINIVTSNWKNDDLLTNIKPFSKYIQKWGKETFGDIFKNKKKDSC